MAMVLFHDARELFEAAREAARDSRRIKRQIQRMEASADGLGGSSGMARVSSSQANDRMAAKTAARVDAIERLERRQEEDELIVDAACRVLYGKDQSSGGLYALCPPWWADALYHYYIGLCSWAEVAYRLQYSKRQVMRGARAALEVADARGMAETVAGRVPIARAML